jgi:hypothetical protein
MAVTIRGRVGEARAERLVRSRVGVLARDEPLDVALGVADAAGELRSLDNVWRKQLLRAVGASTYFGVLEVVDFVELFLKHGGEGRLVVLAPCVGGGAGLFAVNRTFSVVTRPGLALSSRLRRL